MRLYNARSKQVEAFEPLNGEVKMYTCGPTVYDHAHIGNLSSFVFADTLKRVLRIAGFKVQHAMNFTDIDDKTIKRSKESKETDPRKALEEVTRKYEKLFLEDMELIGNETKSVVFIRATESIEAMQKLILELLDSKVSYIADDGIYFSIENYKKSGKKYGQLVEVDDSNTSQARIKNDEYDKDSVHDFALWKLKEEGEPAWDFEVDGKNLEGRPGWHIECSAMSMAELDTPFDIHTGGIDLAFPHHENEIAQSTGATEAHLYSNFFTHNEHLLVDNSKMSKSSKNFYTLEDVKEKGFEPIVFRLVILQSHYRNRTNFTWESMQAAKNRLGNLRNVSALRFQTIQRDEAIDRSEFRTELETALEDDLNTPRALEFIGNLTNDLEDSLISQDELGEVDKILKLIDEALGLELLSVQDITDAQKKLIEERQKARDAKDFDAADNARDELEKAGIGVRDTESGPIWYRV